MYQPQLSMQLFPTHKLLFSSSCDRRALEEVRASHWLPQSGSYKLVEFIKTEQNQKKEFERSLEVLCQSCRDVLNMVQREKHRSLQQLQHHVRLSQQAQYFSGPMYLHQRHQQELKKELHTAEHHLSRFMALVQLLNYMCVETVVSVVQQDVTRFTHNLLEAQCLVFQTEMIIDPEGRLSVEPGLQQVLCVLSELLSHKDYVLQAYERRVCDQTSALDLDSSFSTQPSTNEPGVAARRGAELRCCQLSQLQQGPGVEEQSDLSLNKDLLEWTLSVCDVSQAVRAAESHLQKELDLGWLWDRFSWLLEVHDFVQTWNPLQCVSPRGQCVSPRGQCVDRGAVKDISEHILKVHGWLGALHSAPPSVSSTTQTFEISCTGVTHKLEQKLRVIDEELLKYLVEEVRVCSQSLISELGRPTVDLLLTQQDFTQYAFKVQQWFSLWPGLKQRLDHTLSLQDMIVGHYRELSVEEQQRSAQVESLWGRFGQLLQEAERCVCRGLPVHAHTLELMFSFCFTDLSHTVSQLSHGVFVDPEQDAAEVSSRLRVLWTHVLTRQARLEQLRSKCELLQETPKDMSSLSTRLELWASVLFTQMDVVQAEQELEQWSHRVQSIICHLPVEDRVLQKTTSELQQQRHHLDVLKLLKEPCLKHKHWKAVHRDSVEGQAEHNMESEFATLQQQWSERLLTVSVHQLQCTASGKHRVQPQAPLDCHRSDSLT
ncbi:hypothetical protein WMY93_005586 [Mugilogobius chulae]|uniref:Dynein heavy chain linker domain-containing protein n=1 Tax=Mugilogobius chulae TaxID=88201 RepID=A0AAW0PLU3_9GOBI